MQKQNILSLQSVKNFLRVDHKEDDALICNYIDAAIEYAKKYIGNSIDSSNSLLNSTILIHVSLLYDRQLETENIRKLDQLYSKFRKKVIC